MANGFLDKLTAKWNKKKFVCIGLDRADFEFNKSIIDQTHDLVCTYKPNIAFYEDNLEILKKTARYIQENHSDIPLILDAKRADIDSTNQEYAKTIFDELGFDAVTVNPYLGKQALMPFLERTDKGIIVLVKTSNPGSDEFQNLTIENIPLYQVIAKHVASEWNTNNNCAVVVGATYPEELKRVREIIGDMPILIPGIGVQGGDLKAVIKNGLNSKKQGIIISSSREIIFSDNPRQATSKLHKEILKHV